jgi:hypothetical protein
LSAASPLSELQRFAATGEPPVPADDAHAQLLVRTAREQGLSARLDESLLRAGREWPGPAAAALRRAHQAAAYRGEQLLEAGRRARRLLARAGLRALPMKGLALLGCAYEAPAQRPMDDVDLLLLDGWDEAIATLSSDGFEVGERADHAWALRESASGIVVELHRGLSTCPEMFPIDAEALWRRRVGRGEDERPSNEDLLVQLSVHAAFQHGLRLRLGQFLDFRRLLEQAALDEALLASAAQAAQAGACLLASLEAASALVAAPAAALEMRRHASFGLLRRLRGIRRNPLSLLAGPPSARVLAGWRLALVGPRRLELIARTFVPKRGRRGRERLRRGLELVRRLV